ncbi:MAG: hypothetical protein EAZ44_05780 [Cytophagia bacterium]|nr:MAG: hypothetical protein EAZ44_05780 [Cytophagia bacterium]TAG40003.1 MAG: hypothetical protein EAZ31_08745 [Cytophagia bacterium]TAH30470.1 MAG: hypothetical protein EAZ06_03035 [Cytophagales bacterium]
MTKINIITLFLSLFFLQSVAFSQKPERYKGFVQDDIPANIMIEKDPTSKFVLKVAIINAKNIIEFKGEKRKTNSGKTAYYFENKKEKMTLTLYDISKDFGKREGFMLVGHWQDKKHKNKHTYQNSVFYREESDFIKDDKK